MHSCEIANFFTWLWKIAQAEGPNVPADAQRLTVTISGRGLLGPPCINGCRQIGDANMSGLQLWACVQEICSTVLVRLEASAFKKFGLRQLLFGHARIYIQSFTVPPSKAVDDSSVSVVQRDFHCSLSSIPVGW
jgi:hypothetical protein